MIFMQNDLPEHYDNNLIKAHDADFGYDVRAGSDGMLPPRCCTELMETGLHVFIPPIMGAFLKARGSQIKRKIMADGVIDSGYSGTIKIQLYNFSHSEPYSWKKGDKIAQMCFLIRPESLFQELNIKLTQAGDGMAKALFPEFKITERPVLEWPDSDRGSNGFGSSGR